MHHLYTALGEWRRTERDARGKVSLIIIYGEKPFQDQEEKGMSEMHFQLPVSSLRNVLRMQAQNLLPNGRYQEVCSLLPTNPFVQYI